MGTKQYKYSNVSAGFGDMFGLSTLDLTAQQLEKISINKLVEFADIDGRIGIILADKISSKSATWEDVSCLMNLDEAVIKKVPNLVQKYNEFLATHDFSRQGYYGKDRYFIWKMLNEANKIKEVSEWLDGKTSVFAATEEDFKIFYDKHKDIARNIVKKLLLGSVTYHYSYNYSYNYSELYKNMFPSMPKDIFNEILDTVNKKGRPYIFYLLSCPHTTLDDQEKVMRELAGKTAVPSMYVRVSKESLIRLPSVMRLNFLESVMFNMYDGSVDFTNIKTIEDMTFLLFGTSVKYNSRVQAVADSFKKRTEKEKL